MTVKIEVMQIKERGFKAQVRFWKNNGTSLVKIVSIMLNDNDKKQFMILRKVSFALIDDYLMFEDLPMFNKWQEK